MFDPFPRLYVAKSQKPEGSLRLLPSLTSLRVFAALFVVVYHTRNTWAHTHWVDVIGQVAWLGVSCFFILSGFVLMWAYNPATKYKEFILRRLIRIYPLHFLCLLVSLTAFALFDNPMAGYVGTRWGTIADFLLIHDWRPGHPYLRQAWNGVSWTLSCELFFYLVAPPFFRLMSQMELVYRQFYCIVALWAMLLAASFIGSFTPYWAVVQDLVTYHPIPRLVEFMLGASGALLMRSGWQFRSRSLSLGAIIVPIALYCVYTPESGGHRSGAVMIEMFAPGAFLLIMAMAKLDIEGYETWTQNSNLVFLGEASFALYMTHALLLNVFTNVRNRVFPVSNTSHLWGEAMTLAFLVLALVFAAMTHIWIEQPIRISLMRKFGMFGRKCLSGGLRSNGTESPIQPSTVE